jgi:glycosyltransferase involved in cell wall biosynthesis
MLTFVLPGGTRVRVLQVFNQYRSLFNGEQAVVERTEEMLARKGVPIRTLIKSSRDLSPGLAGKAYAFASGIYNSQSATEILREVKEFGADIVHAHNVYPLFSPSIFRALSKHRIPVVLSLHNQQLTCPRADHLRDGKVCDTCLSSSALNCGIRNCRGNRLESWAYAIRSQAARKMGLFRNHVTRFIALTEFAKTRLVQAGFDEDQIRVLPNMAPGPHDAVRPEENKYVAFAGRLSAEKGIPTLLKAAEQLPDIQFRLAGAGPEEAQYRDLAGANVTFVGKLEGDEMPEFYRQARVVVLPSNNYEMCPLVIGEAMSHGVPVVATRIGGIPELVDEGETGLLFEPNDSGGLAAAISTIYESETLCRTMGTAAWNTARTRFSEDRYFQLLTEIYEGAIRVVTQPAVTSHNLEVSP